MELLRGQEAAVHPPGLEEQGEGYPETRGCFPPGTGGQRGDKVFPGDQEVASTPQCLLESAGISVAGLNRTPWEQPGLALSPPPKDTAPREQLPREDRQKDKHRVESHQMNVQPSGKGGSHPRTAGSPGGAHTSAEPHCEGKDKVGTLS